MTSLSDFTARTLAGEQLPLSRYAGSVVLVVNTASRCGFTPQYAGLQALHQKYADQGLAVLGFPCNQFGKQEPGDTAETGGFCEQNFGVGFAMFDKVEVNAEARPPALPLVAHREERRPG